MPDRHNDNYSIEELRILDERLREAAGVAHDSPNESPVRQRGGIFARRRMAVTGFACAAFVALSAAILLPTGKESDLAREPVTLAPLSKRVAISLLARNASTGALDFPRRDQFFHTRWERKLRTGGVLGVTPGTGSPTVKFAVDREETEDRWVSLDREGASRTDVRYVHYPTARDLRIAKQIGGFEQPGVSWGSYDPARFIYLGARSYSREELINYRPTPARLLEDVARRPMVDYSGDRSGNVWSSLLETMANNSLPVHLRAGLVRAIGLIPRVEILGPRLDRLGRQGYAFGLEHDGLRDEVLLDATTAQVLRLRTVVVRPAVPYEKERPGTVVIDQLLTAFEVTDELPAQYFESPSSKGEMPSSWVRQDKRRAAEEHRRDRKAIERRERRASEPR